MKPISEQTIKSEITLQPRSINLKRWAGVVLLNLAETLPAAKPLLRRWGLRTSQEWFAGRVVRIQLPEGRSAKVGSLYENYLTFELFWRGVDYYEPITALLARKLAQPGAVFIDVGANVGFYTLLLSICHPGLRVVAFEPNPRMYELLVENIRLNNLAQVVCEPLAVSDAEGEAALYLSASDMSASLEPGFEESRAVLKVCRTSLDRYLARHQVSGPLLLKVDIEGHEASFFRGAMSTLETRRPDIISEVAGADHNFPTTALKKLGYRFYQITDQGLLPSEELTCSIREPFVFLNCLLTPRPEPEVQALSRELRPHLRRIDLRQTSKHLSPALLAQLKARQPRSG